MVAMLPGVVEAAGLVRDACKTFGDDTFGKGCGFGCGANSWNGADYGACSTTEWTPAECNTRCVRHRPHVLLAPPASPTAALRVRFTTWCCTRSFVCLCLCPGLTACSHFTFLSLLLFTGTSIDFQQVTMSNVCHSCSRSSRAASALAPPARCAVAAPRLHRCARPRADGSFSLTSLSIAFLITHAYD